MIIEEHPLQPFLPENGRMLFLGSFPPPQSRWSMEWFYPNWINDFWRIQGLLHFGDKGYFEQQTGEKAFDRDRIVDFCRQRGLAFFDTARKVCRLKDNAADEFLQILEPTDVFLLLESMPLCRYIVTTGGKASEELLAYLQRRGVNVSMPRIGEHVEITYAHDDHTHWHGYWWRMPSTSRAYPMKLEKKAEFYRLLF